MKISGWLIACLTVFSMTNSPTSAATLNLDKFSQKGKAACAHALGADEATLSGDIYFIDGAGSLDLPPLFDHAAFIYAVSPPDHVLPREDLLLGYRVGLNGIEDLVAITQPDHNKRTRIVMPREGIIALKPETPLQTVEKWLKDLSPKFPEAVFVYLDTMNVVIYVTPITEAASVATEVRKSDIVETIELSYEHYRVPFIFSPLHKVEGRGSIDPDSYRTITRELKEAGFEFATRTTIPEDLK